MTTQEIQIEIEKQKEKLEELQKELMIQEIFNNIPKQSITNNYLHDVHLYVYNTTEDLNRHYAVFFKINGKEYVVRFESTRHENYLIVNEAQKIIALKIAEQMVKQMEVTWKD